MCLTSRTGWLREPRRPACRCPRARAVSDLKTGSRLWTWLGLQTVETGEGTATIEMKATGDMANHSGFGHGGMNSTLAESAMGRSLPTVKPGVGRAKRFDLKLNFISAGKLGGVL